MNDKNFDIQSEFILLERAWEFKAADDIAAAYAFNKQCYFALVWALI